MGTSTGQENVVGKYPNQANPLITKAADYALYFPGKQTYVLPKSKSTTKTSCLTGIDVSMFQPAKFAGVSSLGAAREYTNTWKYNYFWNVGVKYNDELKKYPCSGGGAASGGSVAGALCLLVCGAGIYYTFNKNKEQPAEEAPEEPAETPQQEMTTTTT